MSDIRCFISYRRREENWALFAIKGELESYFVSGKVFLDQDGGINQGTKFWKVIQKAIAESDVLLVAVDEEWESPADIQRLHAPDDFVRMEIETALSLNVLVMPMLIGSAKMPNKRLLPESIRDMCDVHSARVRAGEDFPHDIGRLRQTLDKRASAARELRHRVEDLLRDWGGGNWDQTREALIELISNWQAGTDTAAVPLAIRPKLELANTLVEAQAAFNTHDFAQAVALLRSVDPNEGPANLAISLKLAELGAKARIASEARDERALMKFVFELDKIEAECAAIAPMHAPGRAQVREFLRDSANNTTYEDALRQFHSGAYEDAAALFREAGNFRDAPAYAARCERWVAFLSALRSRNWDGARAQLHSLTEIEPLERRPLIQDWRRWCSAISRAIPVLEQMSVGDTITSPMTPREGGQCPYVVLGLPTSAAMERVQDLSFDLQAKPGGMSLEERASWDALRLAQKRLAADFCLYRVADAAHALRVQDVLAQLAADDNPTSLTARLVELRARQKNAVEWPSVGALSAPLRVIAEALGSDGPVFSARLGDYSQAIAHLWTHLQETPNDVVGMHHMALAAAAKIAVEADQAEDLSWVWDRLIIGLGVVFTSDDFWHSWFVHRRAVYNVTQEDVQTARSAVQSYWIDSIRAQTGSARDLELEFQLELMGARAAAAAGGIPLGGGKPGRRAIVGPIGVRELGLGHDVARWSVGFDGLPGDPPWVKQARICFSALGRPAAQMALGRFSAAAASLDAALANRSVDKSAVKGMNPADPTFILMAREMAIEAQTNAAVELIMGSPLDVQAAVSQAESALRLAKAYGDEHACSEQLVGTLLGRAAQLRLERDPKNRLPALNEAIALLDATLHRGWADDDRLTHALAEAYVERSICLANDHFQYAQSRHDATKAWALEPDSLLVLANMIAAHVSDARDQFMHYSRKSAAEELLREAAKHFERAELLFPDNSVVREWRAVERQLARHLRGEATEALETLLRSLPDSDDHGSNADNARLAEALMLMSNRQFGDAAELIWSLWQRAPADDGLRAQLLTCYRRWLVSLINNAVPPQVAREVHRAAAARLGAAAFSDFEPYLVEAL